MLPQSVLSLYEGKFSGWSWIFFFNGWGTKCISFSSLCCSLIDSKCLQLLLIALLPSLGHHAACRVQGWQTAGLQADL